MKVLRRRRVLLLALLAVVLGLTALALARSPRKGHRRHKKVDYATHIKPILETHCYRCHGEAKTKAELRLDSLAGIRKGGVSGGVIIPGDGGNSLLVTILTESEDRPRMPPSGPSVSAEDIALIKAWIDAGAVGAVDIESEGGPVRVDHWAFRAPVAAAIPSTRYGQPAGNAIDAFLAVGREQRGLIANAAAPRAVLVRRVFIDLIGLPPTREELSAARNDESDEWYEKVVDRLLNDPRYGERWGRHWMDVWRYSDPDGRKAKEDIWWGNPHIWRWRDWIVRALNEDKGYDRMVVEMLAGDEVAPDAPGTLAATGFLVRNWFKLDRNIWLSNTIEHTGKAFLGLSIGCARCHDHKFDPLSQKEYYQFRAFFEPHDVRTDAVPGESGPAAMVARVYDAKPDDPTWVFVRGDARTPDKSASIPPGVPAMLGTLPAPQPSRNGTGRRLALASWIGDRQNPLTARVAINHIWLRHFGTPLVENITDFGLRTPAPAQQQLLDWLAVELMDHGWSMKHVHRLMVTSAAYRMRSSMRDAPSDHSARDPDNHYYWRANARRMEAEVVRDSLLSLAGALEATAGGPPVDPGRGVETGRRSLYYRYSREDKTEFLTTFDAPGVEECYRREQTVVPQQALALENSAFVWDQARRIARRLENSETTPALFVRAAFEHVLGRPPEPAEAETCAAFLVAQETLLSDPASLTPLPATPPLPVKVERKPGKRRPRLPLILGDAQPLPPVPAAADPASQAREYLIHALLNHNDFITVR